MQLLYAYATLFKAGALPQAACTNNAHVPYIMWLRFSQFLIGNFQTEKVYHVATEAT